MSADYILLFGLPGTGKGTLAQRISGRFPVVHISCGDVFRRHVAARTGFGLIAKSYIDSGQLTPDAETSRMFLNHLAAQSSSSTYLIEGFPRTVEQARALDAHLLETGRRIGCVIFLDAPVEVLEERLQFRRVCSKCGRIFNLRFSPPLKPGICNSDGEILVQRSDDKIEIIRPRIALYKINEDAVIAFYSMKNSVYRIDATSEPASVFEDAQRVLSKPSDGQH